MKFLNLVLILLTISPAAFACTCVNTKNYSDAEYSKMLKQVKAIFYGEVISLGGQRFVEENYGDNKTLKRSFQPVNFKVLRAWKGVDSNEITVETEASSSCKYLPAVGSRVIIYAYQNKNARKTLFINQCSANFDNDRMKRQLGEGKDFEQFQIQQTQQTENNESVLARFWKSIAAFFS